ncbi:unnamed protein product [Phytomonas sp. EM1]|nr:unnamed protein product [Phytomonas sp. EM1]|eukprot:CCW62240.1 unnamed protein product [Phytomonas sp. isolate EM1]
MRAQHWKVLCVHRAITRWVLRMRGRALLDELRQLRDAKRAQQRHHEEVFAATTCIQRAVRLWLLRRSSAHKLKPLLLQKRLLVQEAFKMAAAAEEQKLKRIRAYCAVMIQSVWRSYKCRQQVVRYRQFITVIRRYQQENELARCAVVKLQAVARGFLARCRWQSRTQTIPLSSSSGSIEVQYISNPFESACVLSANSSEEDCEAVEKNSASLSFSVVPLSISDSDQAPTSCSVAPTMRQHRAATMIQKTWRGYWLRKCIECFCKEFDLEFSQENS